MGRLVVDPYFVQSPIGEGIASLGKALLSGPTAAENARNQAQANYYGMESEEKRRKFAGNDAVANYAAKGTYDSTGQASALADAIRGGRSGQDVGDVIRALAYNLPGASQGVRDSSFMGAGGGAGNTETGHKATLDNAITRTGMEQGGENSRNSARIASQENMQKYIDNRTLLPAMVPDASGQPVLRMVPKSVASSTMFAGTPVLAKDMYSPSAQPDGTFSLKPNMPGVSVAGPHPIQPFNVQMPGGGVAMTNNGLTTLRGAPIPDGSERYGTQGTMPIGQGEATALNNQNRDLTLLEQSIGDLRGLATPERMGAVGLGRRTAQDAILQGDAFGKWLGVNTDDIKKRVGNIPGFDGQFDRGNDQLDTLANIIAYRAAAALGQQSGRGASDKDIARWRALIGDSGMLANPQGLNARLDVVQREVQREMEAVKAQASRSGRPILATPPAGGGSPRINPTPQGAAPTLAAPTPLGANGEGYDKVPPGAQYVAPDGTVRTKGGN